MSSNKPYNLEERTFLFAKEVRLLIKKLERTIANAEDSKQLIRSSGSVGRTILKRMNPSVKKIF